MHYIVYGLPGSGSSTTVKAISQITGLPFLEIGEIFKTEGKKGGNYGSMFDEAVDSWVVTQLLNNPGMVITTKDLHQHPEVQRLRREGRALLIRVMADEDIRAERVARRKKQSQDQVKKDLRYRLQTDTETYQNRYRWFNPEYNDFDIVATNNFAPDLSGIAIALSVDIGTMEKVFAEILNQELFLKVSSPDYESILQEVRELQKKLVQDSGDSDGGYSRTFVIT
jgi:cytidylate kinase